MIGVKYGAGTGAVPGDLCCKGANEAFDGARFNF